MLKRRLRSFKYAWQGVIDLFSYTANAKIHLGAALFCVFLGFSLNISPTEWCFIIVAISLVIMAEAFNTSIEYLCNHSTMEYNEQIKKTKDVAAAAVLIAAIGSAILGLIIFLPKLILLFGR